MALILPYRPAGSIVCQRVDLHDCRGNGVTAARELFIDAGYDATPMGPLAAAAGVSANTVYWCFDDKDDVLIAVLDAVMAMPGRNISRWPRNQTSLSVQAAIKQALDPHLLMNPGRGY